LFLCKLALLPLFDQLKHLLTCFGKLRHDLLIAQQNYLLINLLAICTSTHGYNETDYLFSMLFLRMAIEL
jgi:hypothetical protein